MLDGGPVRYGGDDALGHLPVEGNGGVEEVGGGEEEADGGEGRDGAREASGEAGRGGTREEVLEEEADGLEVEEEDDGENGEADSVEEEEQRRLPVVHAVDRVDLRPISARFSHFARLSSNLNFYSAADSEFKLISFPFLERKRKRRKY